MKTTVEAFDGVSVSSFNVQVDLSWTAVAGIVPIRSHFLFVSPDSVENIPLNGSICDAAASGNLSIGGVNFIPDPS
jgi:hypothetical protein